GIANMANAPCDVVGLRERNGLSGVAGIEVKFDRDDKQCNWWEKLVLYVLGITGYKFVVLTITALELVLFDCMYGPLWCKSLGIYTTSVPEVVYPCCIESPCGDMRLTAIGWLLFEVTTDENGVGIVLQASPIKVLLTFPKYETSSSPLWDYLQRLSVELSTTNGLSENAGTSFSGYNREERRQTGEEEVCAGIGTLGLDCSGNDGNRRPFELAPLERHLETTPEGGVSTWTRKGHLINHNIEAKAIWDNVKMLLAGFELTKEDRESQLYDEFERFKMLPGENINEHYVQFHKLVNDMKNIRMTMPNIQLNSKFVNNMSPEWDRFVTAVNSTKHVAQDEGLVNTKEGDQIRASSFMEQSHRSNSAPIDVEEVAWSSKPTGNDPISTTSSLFGPTYPNTYSFSLAGNSNSETPIVQSVDIGAKPSSYAGAAGASNTNKLNE
ncbi:hypothetical protein Tco_0856063, partial [Tanacetum coccineum]